MRCVFCFLKIHFMKNKLLLLICIFPLWLAAQQKITVSGYVYEKGSLESLPGILVYEPQSSNGVRTNNYGFYALTFPYTDSLYVVFSCIGFDKAVATMKVGEKVDIHLAPEEAYGPVNPNAIIELPIASLPGSEELTVGEQVVLTNGSGRQFPVKVIAKTDDMIRLDANHEMAGKELNFSIELIEVTEG